MLNFSRLAVLIVCAVLSLPLIAEESETPQADVISYDLSDVLKCLSNALEIHDEIPSLEASKYFGRDVESATAEINELLDDAIEMLGSESIKDLRETYRKLELKIRSENNKIVNYKSKRVMAPLEGVSIAGKITPTETLKRFVATTKGDYEKLIELSQLNLDGYRAELDNVKAKLSDNLKSIGITLTPDQLETLMASVVGDDVISMSVVFKSVNQITSQLETLTEETSENLEHAKRYYGMVVILYRIVGVMQNKFIAEVDDNYLPKLTNYKEEAHAYIAQSKELMNNGVNLHVLNANIEANHLTIKAIDLYISILERQKSKVTRARDIAVKEALVADNTYSTVSLSSAVVSMIKEGRNTFESLMSIQMPDIREFKNEEIRSEFKKLTAKMSSI